MTFALNNREYTSLYIVNYAVKLETLDGEGTGRTKARNWPMIRDPQGVIINLAIEFAGNRNNSKNAEFRHLWQTCKSMGTTDFARVRFIDPLGEEINQDMYLVASELKYKRIDKDNTVYTDSLTVAFIAKEGIAS